MLAFIGGFAAGSSLSPIRDQTLSLGENRNVSIVGAFTDPEGDPLTYTVESSQPTTVNEITPTGTTFRIVAVAIGNATITVTATDNNGEVGRPAVAAFTVTVIPPAGESAT